MKIAIVGATKGMGRALARRLAQRGDQLFLLGRDVEDLERSARDLEARSGVEEGSVSTAFCDLAQPESFEPALDAAMASLGGLDGFIVTAGLFAPQEKLEGDLETTRQLLEADFSHTVLLCEVARPRLLADGGGSLVVFSSVAGDRGRKPVVLYGAAKAGLSRYLEGLDHKFHQQGLHVLDVKPGFVKTGMTEGLKPPPFAGNPEQVAADVVRALERKKAVLYTPWPWRWVLLVIRCLPRFVMRRIGF